MKVPKQARRDAKQLFRGCLVNGALDENRARQAVTAVIERKPRKYLAVLTQFERMVKMYVERRSGRVESATGLSEAEMAAVRQNLTAKYGAGLSLTFWINPTLIGGLRIQVGSDVYDGSVKARLNQLRESF